MTEHRSKVPWLDLARGIVEVADGKAEPAAGGEGARTHIGTNVVAILLRC